MARLVRGLVILFAFSLLANAFGGDELGDARKQPAPAAAISQASPTASRSVVRSKRIRKTGHALDLAIDGEGYFQLAAADDPRETYYTRRGRFDLDHRGRIILHAGKRDWLLTPGIEEHHESALIEITNDGQVWVTDVNDLAKSNDHREMVGMIQLARFDAATTLTPCGDGIYRATGKGARSVSIGNPGFERGELRQGCLEESTFDAQEKR